MAGNPPWRVIYTGGGPWDGGIEDSPTRIRQHVLTVRDGIFEGYQIYEAIEVDMVMRTIVMEFAGERWAVDQG